MMNITHQLKLMNFVKDKNIYMIDINYSARADGIELEFLPTYIAENNKYYKNVKTISLSLTNKPLLSDVMDIISRFKQIYDVKSIYVNSTFGLHLEKYETYDDDGFDKVDSESEYLQYAYLFLSDNDHAIRIAYNPVGVHALTVNVVNVGQLFNQITPLIEWFRNGLSHLRIIENERNKIHFICHNGSNFYLAPLKIKSGDNVDLHMHYNDDFGPVSDTIIKALRNDKGKGIVLLHGKHGTGKTSYLRYLLSILDKNIIYVSPDMSNRISDPSFLSFLMQHKNSILIIEDAENVIRTREAGENQAVANLLNVTDGILGDGLNFKVICTFNTGFENIDPALRRKGRMIAQYEFTDLSEEKTQNLVKSLYGENSAPEAKTMSLAEIFNMNDSNFDKVKTENKIGFY